MNSHPVEVSNINSHPVEVSNNRKLNCLPPPHYTDPQNIENKDSPPPSYFEQIERFNLNN